MAKIDINLIEKEVLDGLPNSRRRLDEALFNVEFYECDFSRFPVRDPNQNTDGNRYQRNSQFMRRVVDTLSALLYKDGPERSLTDHPQASAWLEACYAQNSADAILQRADAMSFVTDVVAIQAEPDEDPDCPVRLRIWDGSAFEVWTDPDEPCEAEAVATIDFWDHRRRLRLWTEEEVRTYLTNRHDERTKTAGATAFRFAAAAPNTLGILPFAFVHVHEPTSDFWTAGPGLHLRETNDWINKRLTDLFDSCRYNLNPIVKLKGTRAGWRPPSPTRPGDVWDLPPALDSAAEQAGEPDADYLQADPGFVAAGWDDLQYGIDHSLEMAGVPPAMVRLTQDSARSGISIVAEQLESVKHAQIRQRMFARYEQRLAKVVLTVGASHLGSQTHAEYQATAAQLKAAADSPGLQLRWPSLFPKLPGTEADQSDQWLLDNKLTSRTLLVMEREGLTREEAEAYMEEVAEDLARERDLLGEDPAPTPLQPAMAVGQPRMAMANQETNGDGA